MCKPTIGADNVAVVGLLVAVVVFGSAPMVPRCEDWLHLHTQVEVDRAVIIDSEVAATWHTPYPSSVGRELCVDDSWEVSIGGSFTLIVIVFELHILGCIAEGWIGRDCVALVTDGFE